MFHIVLGPKQRAGGLPAAGNGSDTLAVDERIEPERELDLDEARNDPRAARVRSRNPVGQRRDLSS
jgi:hypothetical protein